MTRLEAVDVDGALVLGAGIAGLYAALKLAPFPATVISPERLGGGASSAWAQAGIAAAIGLSDAPRIHAEDTVRVGAGIVDEEVAKSVVQEAPLRIDELARFGVRFDRSPDGGFALVREAGHRRARVAGSRSDGAGQEIMGALIAAVRSASSVHLMEGALAVAIGISDGRAVGAFIRRPDRPEDPPTFLRAPFTILAAGGLCGLYAVATTPPNVRGQAMGMAAVAGAQVSDAEFVQFHPTAIACGRDPAPLASEALRGAGATLVDGTGERFMVAAHADAEMAPRDVVAREVFQARVAGLGAYLDARPIFSRSAGAFPNVARYCRESGIDPAQELIPVEPAAHFHIGGVRSDSRGRSSVPNLFVCGEAAATGLHGANRLGSNSLLEATVFAARVAEEVSGARPAARRSDPPGFRPRKFDAECEKLAVQTIRTAMTEHVGVTRDATGLRLALRALGGIAGKTTDAPSDLGNMVAAATLVAAAALRRNESRGAHHRRDYPDSDPAMAVRKSMTLAMAESIRDEAAFE